MYARPAVRRQPVRRFPVQFHASEDGLSLPLIAGLVLVSLIVASGYLLFERVAQTASLVFETEKSLVPILVRRNYGPHDVVIPGEWLTHGLRNRDEGQPLSLRMSYRTLLAETETRGLAEDNALNDSRFGVLLRPSDSAIPQTAMLSDVYIPNSIPRSIDVAGLEARAFNERTGYDGETLYIGRDAGRTFVARCADTGRKSVRFACLHTVHVSPDLEFVFQFPTALLGDWRRFDVASDALVRQMLSR